MSRQWHNEPWRKLYTRMDGAWMRLPVLWRSLGSELIKYAGEDGALIALRDGEMPGPAIAEMMGAREFEIAVVVSAVDGLLRDGYLERDGASVRIRNFKPAQERLSPAALRKRRQRERELAAAEEERERDNERDSHVTERDAGHGDVTMPCHASSQGDETRRDEEENSLAPARVIEPPPPLAPVPRLTGAEFQERWVAGTETSMTGNAEVRREAIRLIVEDADRNLRPHLEHAVDVIAGFMALREEWRTGPKRIKCACTVEKFVEHFTHAVEHIPGRGPASTTGPPSDIGARLAQEAAARPYRSTLFG